MRDALTLRAIYALACAVVPLALGSCDPCDSSLDPVKCSDLCEQATPHRDCAKCRGPVRDRSCPQCKTKPAAEGCPNAPERDGSMNDASDDGAIDGMTGGSGGDGSGGSGGTGVSGGMGGDAGDSGLVCEEDESCPPAQAVCGEDNRCGPCADSNDCALHAGALVCDLRPDIATTGRCVDCLEDEDCSSANAPHCVLGFCVECETHGDCMSLETPSCSASYACEKCEGDAACVGRGLRTTCDTRTSSDNQGACVECRTHTDCDDEEKPQCDATGTCVPCTIDAACEDRMDGDTPTSYCNTRADAATVGRCVQCTGATETLACTPNKSCRQSDGECTGTTRRSLQPCQACEADSECDVGMGCVQVTLGGADPGHFCLWKRSANSGCADDTHLSVRPFSVTEEHASVDGSSEDYCLPPTTCQAYRDALDSVDCTLDSGCGVMDVIDGRCPSEGTAQDNCSYSCDFAYECPSNLPHCDDFCQPTP